MKKFPLKEMIASMGLTFLGCLLIIGSFSNGQGKLESNLNIILGIFFIWCGWIIDKDYKDKI